MHVYKSDGSRWALNEVITPGQFAQLCIAPRDPGECLFYSPSVLGFPGPVGQLPLHAEMLSEETVSHDGVQYRVPQGPSPVTSVVIPHPVAGFVSSSGVRESKHPVGPSASCAPEQSVGSGECGPLPFRLPTNLHATEPPSAVPVSVSEPGLPAQSAEPSEAIDGLLGMPMPANWECGPLPNQMPTVCPTPAKRLSAPVIASGECGPLPDLMPTDVQALSPSPAHGECGPLPFKLPTVSTASAMTPSKCPDEDHGEASHGDSTRHVSLLAPVACPEDPPQELPGRATTIPAESPPVATLQVEPPIEPSTGHAEVTGPATRHGECGLLPCKLPTVEMTPGSDRMPEKNEVPLNPPLGITASNVGSAASGMSSPPLSPRINQCPLVMLDAAGLMRLGCSHSTTPDMVNALLSQTITTEDRKHLLANQGMVWADDEIRWHCHDVAAWALSRFPAKLSGRQVVVLDPLLVDGWLATSFDNCEQWFQLHCSSPCIVVTVVLIQSHWIPVVMIPQAQCLHVHTWDSQPTDHTSLEGFFAVAAACMGLSSHQTIRQIRMFHMPEGCGTTAIAFVAHMLANWTLPTSADDVYALHHNLRARFLAVALTHMTCPKPWKWGNGIIEQVEAELAPFLIQHGVPPEHAPGRAKAAVRSIGAQPIQEALASQLPWKQLKTLGNQVKYQFLLPSELQAKVAAAAGNGPVGRPKGGKKSRKAPVEDKPIALDPAKFAIQPGAFQADGHPLSQQPLNAVGPVTEGIVIVTLTEADPYLTQGTQVSKLPLALLILQCTAQELKTNLPHSDVTVPCRCVVNQEPMLIDMVLVQIGSSPVTKAPGKAPVHIDTVDVGTLRLTVFRDEIEGTWDQFLQGPMKYVVHHLPLLRMCREEHCRCPHWHNTEQVALKDALVDVWRRQFMRAGYKPEPPQSAIMFGVSIRVPICLVQPLLKLSGVAGIYAEPRSLDSRTIHDDYAIVWLPKMQRSALNHMCQTNPTAIGIARVGERIGLRTLATQASELSKAVRPDVVYLPAGPKQQFLAGPFPFGTDRNSLTKALHQMAWEARPLQPLASVDNKGSMWLIQSTEEPPANLWTMSHGDVLISRHKGLKDVKDTKARPVATTETIALCNTQIGASPVPSDPWLQADPWGGYVAQSAGRTDASEGLKQLESKIQKAVLASLPQSSSQMEVDDVPDRVQMLEQQMHTMMHKHASLEATVNDHAQRHAAQLVSVQTQLQSQGAELRGHIETQQQNLQAMFESQMSQIRSILKRPRDDNE